MADRIDQLKIGSTSYDIDLPVDNDTRINTCYTVTGLSTVAGSSTSGAYKSVRWYTSGVGNDVSAPYDGMKIMLKVPLAGVSTAGVILSINGNNEDDYHPVAYNVSTVLTTHYPVNTYKIFVYDANATMTCYKASNTAVTVTGVWKGESNYDSNTTTTYGTLDYYFRPYAGANRITRYKLVALDKDNRAIPMTTEQYVGDYASSTTYAKDEVVLSSGTYYKSLQASNKNHAPASSSTWWQATTVFTPNPTPFKPNKIWFMNTTGAYGPNAVLGGQVLTEVGYSTAGCTYNFSGGVVAYRLIYLCGTYDKTTGLFTLDTTNNTSYFTIIPDNTANLTLSNYFTSGKDYILVGATYSSNNYFQLFQTNTLYRFDGTNLVPYDIWNAEQKQSKLPNASAAGKVLKSTNTSGGVEWGDSPSSDTWRGINVNGTPLLDTAISTGSVNFKSGDNVTVSGSGNDITVGVTSIPSSIVSGLGTAAGKDYTSSAPSSGSSDLITSGAVWTAINELPEPMIFKGTLGTGGTIASLPAASASNEGYTYKVITAGTYQSIVCKVGDVVVSCKTGTSTYEWVLIPAGDTDSDTWRQIKVNGNDFKGTAISTGLVNFKNGSNVTITTDGNDISIAGTPDTGATDITTTGTGNAVTSASYDADTRKITLTKGATFLTSESHVGDVVSVGATSGSHIAISGTTANPTVGVESGYSIPLTTKQTEWDGKQAALPTTSTAGKVLKSTNVSGTVEWGDAPSDTWRAVKVDTTEVLSTATTTDPLKFISQNTNNGDITFTYDSTSKGVKATAKVPTVNNGTLTIQGNGTAASTFTANQSDNTTLNIKGSGGTTVTKSANNEITISTGTIPTVDTAISTSSTNTVQNKAIPLYIASRGENLLTNGTCLLQNKYNFSAFDEFDGSDTYYAGGCFKHVGGRIEPKTDEYMPVDVSQTYEISYWARSSSSTSTLYDYLAMYDVDKLEISAKHIMWITGSTTTLAQELKNGDTKVYLTSVAGFNKTTSASYQKGLIFWNYANSFGYVYGTETYSRNVYTNLWSGETSFDTTNNCITLSSAWNKGPIPAGTSVSQSSDGSTYTYMTTGPAGTTNWFNRKATMSGVGKNNASGKFREGTAFIRLGWLIDQNSEANVTWKLSTLSVAKLIPTSTSQLTNDRFVRYDINSQGLTNTQKSNARTNIGAGTSDLTIGTTASTAAAGNHTHTTTLASGGTSTVDLAANTAYTLTAGGTSVVFKTPADNNTNYYATSDFTSSNGTKIATGYSSGTASTTYDLYVPNATDSQAGVITTGDQTFTGGKTFKDALTLGNVDSYGEIELSSTYIDVGRGLKINYPELNPGTGQDMYLTIGYDDLGGSSSDLLLNIDINGEQTFGLIPNINNNNGSYQLPRISGTLAVTEEVPQHQANTTLVRDALHNISNKTLSNYSAVDDYNELWPVIVIKTSSSQTLTQSQAKTYLKAQTGSELLPVYNYDNPVFTYLIFSNNKIYKVQWDDPNTGTAPYNKGLVLYYCGKIAMANTDNEFSTMQTIHSVNLKNPNSSDGVIISGTTGGINIASSSSGAIATGYPTMVTFGDATSSYGTYTFNNAGTSAGNLTLKRRKNDTTISHLIFPDVGDGNDPKTLATTDDISGKLDKVTTTGTVKRVYGISTTGAQATYSVYDTSYPNAIASYNSNGNLTSTTPTTSGEVATKGYVDSSLPQIDDWRSE